MECYVASQPLSQWWRCVLLLAVLTPMVAHRDSVYGQLGAPKEQQQQQHQGASVDEQQQLEPSSKQKPPKPHIVFILADDLGFNDVSWHNDAILMPTLDRLAREGVIMESSYTQQVCTPTRAALLTGRYPHTIGRQGGALEHLQPTGLDPSLPLLPGALRRVGYHTHVVGKWHLGFCNWSYTPTERGFDSFYGFYNSGGSYYTKVSRAQFTTENGTQFVFGYDRRLQRQVYRTETDEYSTFEFAKRARTIITQHEGAEPLFLFLSFQAVHGPTDSPRHHESLYAGIHDTRRRRYLGMVSALDEAVGTVVGALKTAGLYDNSVIVFSTDVRRGQLKTYRQIGRLRSKED